VIVPGAVRPGRVWNCVSTHTSPRPRTRGATTPVGLAGGQFLQGGGFLAYLTNKYAPVLTVIDLSLATPRKAGDVHLGPDAWGGNGVVVIKPQPAH